MTLPRFSSGQFGALRWDQLNEAFDLVDAGVAEQPRMPVRPERPQPMILATIGTYDSATKRHAWSESVVKPDGTVGPLVPGRRSAFEDDPYMFPAMSPDGNQVLAGTVVTLAEIAREDGRAQYVIVSGGSQIANVNTLIVQGVQQVIHAGRMWVYQVRQALWEFTPPFNWQSTGSVMYALNACENAIDQAGVSIGVGTVVPVGVSASATRMPIKNGTVVVGMLRGSTWIFSIPNGYRYECT